jgi:hypothetical protein
LQVREHTDRRIPGLALIYSKHSEAPVQIEFLNPCR